MLIQQKCCSPESGRADAINGLVGFIAVLLAALLALLALFVSDALGQTADPGETGFYRNCELWKPPVNGLPPDPASLLPILLPGTPTAPKMVKGEIVEGRARSVGQFIFNQPTIVSLWGEHASRRFFTTLPGEFVVFEGDDTAVRRVTEGQLYLTYRFATPSLKCTLDTRTGMMASLEDGKPAAVLPRAIQGETGGLRDVFRMKTGEEKRSSVDPWEPEPQREGDSAARVTSSGPLTKGEGADVVDEGSLARFKREADEKAKPLGRALKTMGAGAEKRPEDPSQAADPAEAPMKAERGLEQPAKPKRKPQPDVATEARAATPAPSAKQAEVCLLADAKPVPIPEGVELQPMQLAGLRNSDTTAPGMTYLAEVGEAFPVDEHFDIGQTAAMLIPYKPEHIVASRDGRRGTMWVSLHGIVPIAPTEPRSSQKDPAAMLTLLVAGGAEEIAISGLDAVGRELRKQRGAPGVDVEWYTPDRAGRLQRVARFDSLDKLVAEAAKVAGDNPLGVLDAAQVAALISSLDRIVTTSPHPIDKVIWVKGAYPVPSNIPKLFEDFIHHVSNSDVVPRSRSGKVAKWLQIVSARMPGFSAAYLKEPIYANVIGDFDEESGSDSFGPRRRLISNAPLMAQRLMAVLSLRSIREPDFKPALGSGEVVGTPVVSSEVFSKRGYIVTLESLAALRQHLEQVASAWRSNAPLALTELVQGERTGFKLPRTLPAWSRLPLKDLRDIEAMKAELLVRRLLDGVQRVELSAGRAAAACTLFFATEEELNLAPF